MTYARIPRSQARDRSRVSLHIRTVGLDADGAANWARGLRERGHRIDPLLSDDRQLRGRLGDVWVCADPVALSAQAAAEVTGLLASDAAVLLVVASGADVPAALERGASDVVVADCSVEELVVRVTRAHQQRHRQEQLAAAAAVDLRFGLWSEAHAAGRVEEQVAIGNRRGRAFSCLAVHIDVFDVADPRPIHRPELLDACVERLRHAVRASDVVFFFDGQQFLVLAPECAGNEGLRFANRLRRVLADRPYTRRDASGVSIAEARVCVGVSTWSPGSTGAEMIARASAAMQQAVRGGPGRVVVADAERRHVLSSRRAPRNGSSGPDATPTGRRRQEADTGSASVRR